MNPIEKIRKGRAEVPSRLTGKLVRIHGNEIYVDIFGIHMGCYQSFKWDAKGVYVFHTILSCEGVVRGYCLKRGEDESVIEVIE
jgi:hypothetical protein